MVWSTNKHSIIWPWKNRRNGPFLITKKLW
jgi:hypothetical protein